jgi:hypothetical protein
MDRMWPVFPFVGGMVLLANFFEDKRRRPGLIFWGANLALSSTFFFLISLGDQDYRVLGVWWPVFLIVAGISFLALWLAQPQRDWGVLFLSVVGMVSGGVVLAANLQLLGARTAEELKNLSPALLILVGLVLLLRLVWAQRGPADGQS